MNKSQITSHPTQLLNITKGLRHVPGSQTYIPGIDGIRALAIIAVMLYHLNPLLLPGGFSGVDVFFVISGYVVSTSLSRDLRKTFWHFILDFYTRRIVRIVPALLVCLLVTVLVTNLFIPDSWLSRSNRDTALYAFFGLSNFALISTNDGYFSPTVDFNPFTHTWSLAVEEQFYLIYPLLFYIWIITQNKDNRIIRNIGNSFIVAVLAASLAYSAHATATNPESAYYLLPSRFWELALGAWLFQMQSNGFATASSKVASNTALMLGVLLIALAFVFSNANSFPFPWAMLSVAGSALLIIGVSSRAASDCFVSRFLDFSAMSHIGKISYSLYLWHWPVYVLFRWTTGLDGYVDMILAVAITFLLAFLSFNYVENPIRHNQFIRSRPKASLALGGCAVVALSWALATSIYNNHQQITLSVTGDKENWFAGGEAQTPEDIKVCDSEIKDLWHDGRNIGLPIDVFKSRNCASTKTIGHRVFVLGDSHASAYSTMLRETTESLGVEVWIYTKAGCGFDFIKPLQQKNRCDEWALSSLADIVKNANKGDVLFLASLRMNRYGNQWGLYPDAEVKEAQESVRAEKDRNLALEEVKRVLTNLDSSGLKVVIDAPKPIFRAPPFRCSDWFNAGNPGCQPGLSISRAELLDHRKPIMDSITKLQAYLPDVVVWDPFYILCPNITCLAFDNSKKPLFMDGDHLSRLVRNSPCLVWRGIPGILGHRNPT